MIDIILDVDTGFDDAVALLMAANAPELNLLGVTVCHGNAPLSVTLPNTRRVLHAGGFGDVPVLAGMDRPLVRPMIGAEAIQTWTMPFDGPGEATDPTHAVDWLINQLISATEPVTLVPLAPLTNIAMALLRAPEIKPKIARMVLMGGAVTGGNTNAVAEFNILGDPEAARVVFLAGVPITMVGLDVTRQAMIGAEDLTPLRTIGSRPANLAAELIDVPLQRAQQRGRTAIEVYDACAVAGVLDPGLIETRDMWVDVETHGELTLGQTVCDVNNRLRREPNVQVGLGIDRARFLDLLNRSLRGERATS